MRTMTDKKRLIFDTTGINRFAEDRKSADPLIAGLTSGYIVRVTATNVEESIATDNAGKRNRLLESILAPSKCFHRFQVGSQTW
jgi:hypothetical protein